MYTYFQQKRHLSCYVPSLRDVIWIQSIFNDRLFHVGCNFGNINVIGYDSIYALYSSKRGPGKNAREICLLFLYVCLRKSLKLMECIFYHISYDFYQHVYNRSKLLKHLQNWQTSGTIIIKYTLTFISYLFDNILSDCFVKKYVMFFVDLWWCKNEIVH